MREIGHREREDRKLLLPGEVESGPAGDEYLEKRTGDKQACQLGSSSDDVLEVIEQHEQMPLAKGSLYLLLRGKCWDFPQAQCLGDGRHDAVGVADWSQRYKADTIGEVGLHHARTLQSQASFANTTRAGDGEQAHLWMQEQITDSLNLLFATDQGCEGYREAGKSGVRAIHFV